MTDSANGDRAHLAIGAGQAGPAVVAGSGVGGPAPSDTHSGSGGGGGGSDGSARVGHGLPGR